MNTWKNKEQMCGGINGVVRTFLWRAKQSHGDVLRYKKLHEGGSGWAHEQFLRARSDRAHWIWCVKLLLIETSNTTLHWKTISRCNNRSIERSRQAAA